jgi:hypothetical protein
VLEQKILIIALMVPSTIGDPFIPWSSISMDFIIGLPSFSSYDSLNGGGGSFDENGSLHSVYQTNNYQRYIQVIL